MSKTLSVFGIVLGSFWVDLSTPSGEVREVELTMCQLEVILGLSVWPPLGNVLGDIRHRRGSLLASFVTLLGPFGQNGQNDQKRIKRVFTTFAQNALNLQERPSQKGRFPFYGFFTKTAVLAFSCFLAFAVTGFGGVCVGLSPFW